MVDQEFAILDAENTVTFLRGRITTPAFSDYPHLMVSLSNGVGVLAIRMSETSLPHLLRTLEAMLSKGGHLQIVKSSTEGIQSSAE